MANVFAEGRDGQFNVFAEGRDGLSDIVSDEELATPGHLG